MTENFRGKVPRYEDFREKKKWSKKRRTEVSATRGSCDGATSAAEEEKENALGLVGENGKNDADVSMTAGACG